VNYSVGRYVFALAVIGSGVCAIVWHDFSNLPQYPAIDAAQRTILANVVGKVEILGGLALLWPKAVRIGAIALGALYLIFAASGIPVIIAHPLVYNVYGNFFEQLSFVAAASILYARSGPIASPHTAALTRIGCYAFATCVVSFALEQFFYLTPTASLVPKWMPPGQMFWAIATTAMFAVAALAMLTGFMDRLAAQLTSVMIAGFGLMVWLPALFAAPHSAANWSEGLETLAIAATAWMVAEALAGAKRGIASRSA